MRVGGGIIEIYVKQAEACIRFLTVERKAQPLQAPLPEKREAMQISSRGVELIARREEERALFLS